MNFDPEYQRVLQLISTWPPEHQASLAAEVLATLKSNRRDRRRPTLARALGLARTTSPAPSDQDVKQWIDQHRDEKYGGAVP